MEAIDPWSDRQKHRIDIEKNLLTEYFSDRTFWNANNTKVEIHMNTNDNTKYVLQILLPEDFPYSSPTLCVISPRLELRNGEYFPESSTSLHTLINIDGHTTICHFHPQFWTQDNTLYQVIMKGRLWLEAYSLYHRTGKTMDKYLKEFGTQEISSEKEKSKFRLRNIFRRR